MRQFVSKVKFQDIPVKFNGEKRACFLDLRREYIGDFTLVEDFCSRVFGTCFGG